MLVLTRSPEQTIIIDDDIKITIFNIYNGEKNQRVRLGIDAPKEKTIRRGAHVEQEKESANLLTQ